MGVVLTGMLSNEQVDVATFHSICPNYLGMHGGEDTLDLAVIEAGIHSSE
jgi:hypothetical protein